MCVFLVFFLSSVELHSVSAGGVYCAKTARARAAALGLDYPGVHGAPDLYGPAHPGTWTGTMPLSPHSNNDHDLPESEPYMTSYRRSQLGVRSRDEGIHKQAHPRSSEPTFLLSHNTYNSGQSEYNTNQVPSLPRGQPVINRKSNFEEVKHVAPLTLTEAPGQFDLVKWDPQGRSKPLSFVNNERDLAVDESVPNRRGMSLSGLPRPQSRGRGIYQRGPTRYGLRRKVPVRGSSGFTSKDLVRGMTGRGPRLTWIRFPGRLAQPLHRGLNVKHFVQGNPVLRRVAKTKSGPVRISQRAKGV